MKTNKIKNDDFEFITIQHSGPLHDYNNEIVDEECKKHYFLSSDLLSDEAQCLMCYLIDCQFERCENSIYVDNLNSFFPNVSKLIEECKKNEYLNFEFNNNQCFLFVFPFQNYKNEKFVYEFIESK